MASRCVALEQTTPWSRSPTFWQLRFSSVDGVYRLLVAANVATGSCLHPEGGIKYIQATLRMKVCNPRLKDLPRITNVPRKTSCPPTTRKQLNSFLTHCVAMHSRHIVPAKHQSGLAWPKEEPPKSEIQDHGTTTTIR